MNRPSVYQASEFNAGVVKIGTTVEQNKKGGKMVYLGAGADGKQRIYLQTPVMPLPFGVSPYIDASGQTQSYSIDCSFRTQDVDPAVKDFMARIADLDELLLTTGVSRSKEFFGKTYSREMVAEFYRKLIKQNNPEYPPILKVKVPLKGGEPDAQFFDKQRNPVSIEYLTKGTSVRLIVELSSIWFINKTFGATLKVVQAQAVARPNRMDTFAFADDGVVSDTTPQVPDVAVGEETRDIPVEI